MFTGFSRFLLTRGICMCRSVDKVEILSLLLEMDLG